jgi:acyl-CoA thioester hydrolase
MSDFRFHILIDARYSDLDPQWHVNNVRYLTFMEQARLKYLLNLGLWDGHDFNRLGMIVADIHISYIAPMLFGQTARMELRVMRMGNKSFDFEYRLTDEASGQLLVKGESVMVAYDYAGQRSIPIPADWRAKISAFEGQDFA